LLEIQIVDQPSGGALAVAQRFNDGDSRGMRESLEDAGLEQAELLGY
jgi:hypothetical protein